MRINARNRVAIVGKTTYDGNIPGRNAIIASMDGLMNMERAINAGCIGRNSRVIAGESQRDCEIKTIPKSHPLSKTVPN
jgi:hypothetical protein